MPRWWGRRPGGCWTPYRSGTSTGAPRLVFPSCEEIESDTRNVLLTLARIWTTLASGEILSKDAAADWALQHLPVRHRAVLARARDMYIKGEDEERWSDLTAVREHADVVSAIHGYVVD